MALRTGHTCGKSLLDEQNKVSIWVVKDLELLYKLGTWCPQPWALGRELLGENPDCLSGLVFTTHTHDDFKCPSPKDYVDMKSWLAYEQNPYSTQWVVSSSCHRETSLGYDISLLSLGYKLTRIFKLLTVRQHLDALISGPAQPYHSRYNPEL
jgi:hypothetical protein